MVLRESPAALRTQKTHLGLTDLTDTAARRTIRPGGQVGGSVAAQVCGVSTH